MKLYVCRKQSKKIPISGQNLDSNSFPQRSVGTLQACLDLIKPVSRISIPCCISRNIGEKHEVTGRTSHKIRFVMPREYRAKERGKTRVSDDAGQVDLIIYTDSSSMFCISDCANSIIPT